MKKYFSILAIIVLLRFVGIWSIVSGGYDYQNKFILFLKELIPNKIAKKLETQYLLFQILKNKIEFINYKLQNTSKDMMEIYLKKLTPSLKKKNIHTI